MFNLTKKQLICFSIAAVIGIPAFLATRGALGNEGAVLLMIGLMLPMFFIAMYERDGQPAETVLRNIIRTRLIWPAKRPYRVSNFYEYIELEGENFAEKRKTAKAAPRAQYPAGKSK